jgi:hypothetical protein
MGGARAECAWGEGPDVLVVVYRETGAGHGWVEYKPYDLQAGSSTVCRRTCRLR